MIHNRASQTSLWHTGYMSIFLKYRKKCGLNAACPTKESQCGYFFPNSHIDFHFQVLLLIDIQLSYINTNHEDFIGFAK